MTNLTIWMLVVIVALFGYLVVSAAALVRCLVKISELREELRAAEANIENNDEHIKTLQAERNRPFTNVQHTGGRRK